MDEKERQLQESLRRQQELAERVQELRSREVELKQENDRLHKSKVLLLCLPSFNCPKTNYISYGKCDSIPPSPESQDGQNMNIMKA